MFAPAKAITNEDLRVEWLTAGNLNGWTDLVKKELIDIGVVFDKPGPVSKCCYLKFVNCPRANQNTFALSYPTQTVGVQSEVSLGHDEDARRFINIDETQHKFSNESEKGGTRALRYAASFITRSGD